MANTLPDQPKGNFTMNLNFKRGASPKAPAITGRISTPEDPETQFAFQAFEHSDDAGKPYWIGPVDMNGSMRQALLQEPQRGKHFVAIRTNGFKVFKTLDDGSPNPAYAKLSEADQAHEDSKPAFWASWTRDPEKDAQLMAHAWEREPNRYGPWASGSTQHKLSKEQLAQLGYRSDAEATAAHLNAPESEIRSRKSRTNTDRDRG